MVFSSIEPIEAHEQRLKIFPILVTIFADVFELVESFLMSSAGSSSPVSYTPQSQFPPCLIHHRVKLPRVLYTAESSSPVSYTPQSQGSPCLIHRRVKLPSVIYTTESSSPVSYTPQSQASQCHIHHRVKLPRVLYTAEITFLYYKNNCRIFSIY